MRRNRGHGSAGAVDPAAERAVEQSLARSRLSREGGAYAAITASEARRAARASAGSAATLPLRGFTMAVKDVVALAGHPIGTASAARSDSEPERVDAPIIARLRAAGAIVVGIATMHELAFGVTGLNAYAGTPANPCVPDGIPGGSSSGSAVAVAEGSARIAVGTDTGGSVRIPAALCGVVGFKPTGVAYRAGRGVLPLAPTLDTVGMLAASVGDVASTHAALGEGFVQPVRPARIGVARAELERADPAVATVVERALAELSRRGCALVDVEWPTGDDVCAARSCSRRPRKRIKSS